MARDPNLVTITGRLGGDPTVQIARNQTTNRQTGGFAGGQAADDYPTDPYAGTWPADAPWQ